MIIIKKTPADAVSADTDGRVCAACGCDVFVSLGCVGAVHYYRCRACGCGCGVWHTDDDDDTDDDARGVRDV